jgi:hypothetical protein
MAVDYQAVQVAPAWRIWFVVGDDDFVLLVVDAS